MSRAKDDVPATAALEEARAAATGGERRRARRLLRPMHAARPGDVAVALALVDVDLALGRRAEALEVATALAGSRPGHAGAQRACGRLLLLAGRVAEASRRLRRAVALDPTRTDGWSALADLAAMRGRRDREIAFLAEGVARAADPAPLRLRLAERRLAEGDAEGASAALGPLDVSRLGDARLARLAGLRLQAGDAAAATELLRRLDPQGPLAAVRRLQEVAGGVLAPGEAAARLRRAGVPETAPALGALAHLAARPSGPLRRIAERAADRGAAAAIDAALGRLRPDFAEADDYLAPPPLSDPPSVTLICPVHRPADLPNLLAQLGRRTWPKLEIVVALDGPAIDPDRLARALARRVRAPSRVLGPAGRPGVSAALNRALAAASGEYVLRLDADDVYLEGYVARTVAYMRRHGAAVSARSHLLVRFDAFDCTALVARTVGRFARRPGRGWGCPGASLAVRREAALALGFDETLRLGEDADFLVRAQGRRLPFVAAPPYDMILRRRGPEGGHTWAASDALLLGRADRLVATGPLRRLEAALLRLGRGATVA